MVNEGRRMRQRRVGMLIAASLVVAALPVSARAAERSFGWHAEVVTVDGASATLRVPVTEATAKRLMARQTPGPVTLVWSAAGDAVVYAPAKAEMADVSYGFLTEASVTSVDAASKLALVTVAVPQDAASALNALVGQWVRVTAPVARRADVVSPVTVAAAPRPAAPMARQNTAVGGIGGAWTMVAIRRSGVGVGADCVFREEAGRLTGTCTSNRFGSTPINGELKGNVVSFRYEQAIQGDSYVWKGELDAAGTAMKGTVQVSDETVAFTASK